MQENFIVTVENLIRKAPVAWLATACEVLRSLPPTANVEFALQRLPATNNADLSFLAAEVLRQALGMMSWEALSWALQTTYTSFHRSQTEQHIELLWSGPSPADKIPARRIDQALYDLIAEAKREILLVTFAAAKIDRLVEALLMASQRGVRIRLILEFAEASEGQLSYDALKAFPAALAAAAEIYYWPIEMRERNQAGRPGKLHAKIAVIDNSVLVSSANLTEDAFSRNLEVGVLVQNSRFNEAIKRHLDVLIATNVLIPIPNNKAGLQH